MDMNRKQFIGSLFAGITVGCNPAFAAEQSEFDKCRADILYWVDNYLTVHDRLYGDLKMSPQQREYLKRVSTSPDYLFCAKGRQIGASTANLVFAHWKTRFFENQHVFIVEPNLMCVERFQEIDRDSIFHTPAPCQEGSMIYITTPKGIERGIDWNDRNKTFILDEFAWWSQNYMDKESWKSLCSNLSQPLLVKEHPKVFEKYACNFIVVSTPADHSDLFSMLVNNVDDSRRLILPSPTRGLKA